MNTLSALNLLKLHQEMLHLANKEASVIVLQMLAGQWNEHAVRLAPLDNMKETLKSLRLKVFDYKAFISVVSNGRLKFRIVHLVTGK